jgi:Fe2+ or Zn2+ uptake regulation protein
VDSIHDRGWFEERMFPGTFSLADLLAQELPPARWIVPDLLPEGVTILAGKPKMGKSWLALGLSVAVASGGVALGTKRVEKGDVLYLALEDNKRRIHRRGKKLLVGGEMPKGITASTEWPRLDEGGAERIGDWLAVHPDARLVVIDTLKKFRPSNNTQRSVYDVDYEALEPLVPIAAEHGVAILVVHHLRKMDADDPLDTISGSTGLSGGVDGTLVLKRDRGKADAYLFVDGRDVEEPGEYALKWDAEIASWTLMGGAEEYRIGETRAKILRALADADDGPMSPTDIATEIGENLDNVKQTLRRMDKDGQVKKVSYGKYSHSSISSHSGHSRHSVTLGEERGRKRDRVTEVTGDTPGQEIVRLLADPPGWLANQLALCREDRDRHLGPTCAALASKVYGNAARLGEVEPVLVEYLERGE